MHDLENANEECRAIGARRSRSVEWPRAVFTMFLLSCSPQSQNAGLIVKIDPTLRDDRACTVGRNPPPTDAAFQWIDVSVETLPDESIQVTVEKPRQGFVDAQRICLHRENDGGIVASAEAWTVEVSAGTKWSFTDIDGRVTLNTATLPEISGADNPSPFVLEYELTGAQSGSVQTARGTISIPSR